MRCLLCSPIQAVEGPLVAHVLRNHPEAQATAALALPLGTWLLARRPMGLFLFYVGILAVALLIAAPTAWRSS